jgi:hypothetical protein
MTAEALGFERPTANSLDSVSDRDFVLEALAAAAITAVHLSRFAEEIVLWTTPQFNFIALSDAFTTGSSIMPQKRNPDAAELVRGKTGRVAGALQGLLMVLKGLPLAYGKDMQEDKEGAFDAMQTISLCLAATAGMVRDMRPTRRRCALGRARATRRRPISPTGSCGARPPVPRRAPRRRGAGRARVGGDRARGADARGDALRRARITAEVYAVLGVDASVGSRTSYGWAPRRRTCGRRRRAGCGASTREHAFLSRLPPSLWLKLARASRSSSMPDTDPLRAAPASCRARTRPRAPRGRLRPPRAAGAAAAARLSRRLPPRCWPGPADRRLRRGAPARSVEARRRRWRPAGRAVETGPEELDEVDEEEPR